MKVQDLMTRPVHQCLVTATANEALDLMWKHDVGALPVVDRVGSVVGMVTDRDLAMAAFLRSETPARIPISGVISRRVWEVSPEDPIHVAEAMMRDHQVRRLPVVERDGRLVGLLTMGDLARAATKGVRGAMAGHLARTLAAVTASRRPDVPAT